MDLLENPNYYSQEKPYKEKYICFNCNKVFKRKHHSDVKGITQDEVSAKCPECNQNSNWIGPKFQAPKTTNIKAWKSIEVLSKIGLLNFSGFAHNKITIPEGNKALTNLLKQIKEDYSKSINKWSKADHSEENSQQIKLFSELIKKIETEIKKL
tara:strand:- start:353 stop:814 length:462 start_codon:yes stop_codon:yes gene_type:complete